MTHVSVNNTFHLAVYLLCKYRIPLNLLFTCQ